MKGWSELSFGERERKVTDEIRASLPPDTMVWVSAIFDGSVVVEVEGEYYRIGYEVVEGGISLAERVDWERVEAQTEWVAKRNAEIFGSDTSDLLVYQGGAVKTLDDKGMVGGFLVLFSGEVDPDLYGDHFTAKTDFALLPGQASNIYYDHGLDPTIGKRAIGAGRIEKQAAGVWIEGQLEERNEYEALVGELVRMGKLGWSSGTAPWLIERKQSGKGFEIKRWPLGVDASLTPTPAEPRTLAVPLRKYATMAASDLLRGVHDGMRGTAGGGFSPEEIEFLRGYIEGWIPKRGG